jgi:hypothetical protein
MNIKKEVIKICITGVITLLFSVLLIQGIFQLDLLEIVISFICIGLMVLFSFIIFRVENVVVEHTSEEQYVPKVNEEDSIKKKTETMYDLITRFDQVENELSDLVIKLTILAGGIDRFTDYIDLTNQKLIEKNGEVNSERSKIVFDYNKEYIRMQKIMKLINDLYSKSSVIIDLAQESKIGNREINILSMKASIESVKSEQSFQIVAETMSLKSQETFIYSNDLLDKITYSNELINEMEKLISISDNFYKTSIAQFKTFDLGDDSLIKEAKETMSKSVAIRNNIKTVNSNINKITALFHELKDLTKEYLKINNE